MTTAAVVNENPFPFWVHAGALVGRPSYGEDERAFRRDIATKFREAMKKAGGLSASQAARQLNISRQAFYQYLNERTTPQPDILARACSLWGITSLRYRGQEISTRAFATKPTSSAQPVALQLDLFKDGQVFENANGEVRIKHERGTLHLTIRMKKVGADASRLRGRNRRRAV